MNDKFLIQFLITKGFNENKKCLNEIYFVLLPCFYLLRRVLNFWNNRSTAENKNQLVSLLI